MEMWWKKGGNFYLEQSIEGIGMSRVGYDGTTIWLEDPITGLRIPGWLNCPMAGKPGAFGIAVAMAVTVPGMEKAAAEALVKAAHEVCPYSRATHGNIAVTLTVA
jgi:hypothetical protein